MEYSNIKYQTLLIADTQLNQNKLLKEQTDILNDDILIFNSLLKENLNKSFSTFISIALSCLSTNTQACSGVYYSHNFQQATYKIEVSYGAKNNREDDNYSLGEGLVGQVIQSGKMLKILDLPPKSMLVNVSNFQLSIHSLYIFPVVFNQKVYGAIQFNFLQQPDSRKITFLKQAILDMASMVENAYHYQHIKELLDESEIQKQQLKKSEQQLSQKLEELSIAKEELDQQMMITDDAHKLLKDNYAQLMQNIGYAYKIKNAFLPQSQILENAFQDYFLMYMPKDTVSGDFYWYHTLNDIQMVAVGDCTGHGVSGAFMSLFAINLLNQIVAHKKIVQPHHILEHLKENVKFFLQQEEQGLHDGFDISICFFEKGTKDNIYLTYAGAKSSIFYTNRRVVENLKGDRISIGGFYASENASFKSQKVVLQKGEKVYFYTDGIIHICNEKRKSYGGKSFKKFVLKNMVLPMEKQKQYLAQEIKIYQGIQKQRDDITVLGITLN